MNINQKFYISENENFSLNFQILGSHKGGQIDLTGLPAVSYIYFVLGGYNIYRFASNFNFSNFSYLYFYHSVNSEYPYLDGIGNFSGSQLSYKNIKILLGLWAGTTYISTFGDVFFNNYDFFTRKQTFNKLAFILAMDYSKKLSNKLQIRLGNYFYFNEDFKLDYGYYFYLRYKFWLN